jgi:hypothetical protein
MTTTYTHARFWKCALQVNPAGYSGAYRGRQHGLDEAAYNQAILAKCQELNIKVVGIADHGNVDAIDALRAVLEPAGIVVFPGFEIASTEKVHMVCLFPERTTQDWTRPVEIEVVNYSNRLEIKSPGALQNSMTIEKMLAGHRSPRNPILIERDYGYVDARGMGVRRKIVPLVREFSGEEARFEATDDYL